MRVSPWLRYHCEVVQTLRDAIRVVRNETGNPFRTNVYLCGGINGLNDAQCKDWRAVAREELGAYGIIDPMARDYRGREDECVDEIVEGDKRDVLIANVVLVNAARPSWGTAMEIMFAWVLRFFLVRLVFSVALRTRCRHPKRIVAFMEPPGSGEGTGGGA